MNHYFTKKKKRERSKGLKYTKSCGVFSCNVDGKQQCRSISGEHVLGERPGCRGQRDWHMLSGEQDAAVSAHTAPGRCVTEQRLLSLECARLLAPSHSGLSENPGRGGWGAHPGPVPVADADPLLPHGVEQHGDAVQGLGDVRHGHSGAGSPQAEEQLLDVADAAGQEDDGRHQGPHIDALRREAGG